MSYFEHAGRGRFCMKCPFYRFFMEFRGNDLDLFLNEPVAVPNSIPLFIYGKCMKECSRGGNTIRKNFTRDGKTTILLRYEYVKEHLKEFKLEFGLDEYNNNDYLYQAYMVGETPDILKNEFLNLANDEAVRQCFLDIDDKECCLYVERNMNSWNEE